jgi:hypothetical protein
MFTFRAQFHGDPGDLHVPAYQVHEADTYDVSPIKELPVDGINVVGGMPKDSATGSPPRGTAVTLRRGRFPLMDDNTLSLYVGLQCPFSVVFVMNENGKTIDTIR